MNQFLAFLSEHQSWLIPLALYLAINLARRDYLVKNENPVIRWLASALERVLFLQWDRWGGSFKALGIVSPEVPKDE